MPAHEVRIVLKTSRGNHNRASLKLHACAGSEPLTGRPDHSVVAHYEIRDLGVPLERDAVGAEALAVERLHDSESRSGFSW
jgi:hypothetical protein